VGATGRAPALDFRSPGVARRGEVDHGIRAEVASRAPVLVEQLLQPREQSTHVPGRRTEDEPVPRAGGAPARDRGEAAEPDRDVPGWLGQEAGALDPMEFAGEVDHGIAPELAQERHLLVEPRAALGERNAERVVLDAVPARADAEPQAAAREQVE